MTIQVTCSGCFRTYGVKDQYAGRRIKCPDCSAPVQIPDGSGVPPAEHYGGDDDFGDQGFGSSAPSPPRSRTRPTASSARKESSGSSLPVIGIMIGVVGVIFVLPCCGGIIWFALNFDGNNDPIAAAEQDHELDAALAGRQIGGTREETGRLSFSDPTFEDGEYYDEYTISANAGDIYVIDLYSDDFDPFLTVRDEYDVGGFELTNDDFGGTDHSQVILTAPNTDDYIVFATTFSAGETGAYELKIRKVDPAAGAGGPMREETGSLDFGDDQLEFGEGEYVDVYTLNAEQGDLYVIDLHSNAFDTYLLVTGPGDFYVENDDFGTSTSQSQITLLAPETGVYEISVTSYEAGETGAYRLTIQEN